MPNGHYWDSPAFKRTSYCQPLNLSLDFVRALVKLSVKRSRLKPRAIREHGLRGVSALYHLLLRFVVRDQKPILKALIFKARPPIPKLVNNYYPFFLKIANMFPILGLPGLPYVKVGPKWNYFSQNLIPYCGSDRLDYVTMMRPSGYSKFLESLRARMRWSQSSFQAHFFGVIVYAT